MAYGTRVAFEPIREVAFISITANFIAVGPVLSDFGRVISFTNTTDVPVYFSFDGINNHLRLEANAFKLFDLTANTVHDNAFFLARNTTIFIKQVLAAPTTGSAHIELMFAEGGV